jgi:REP element-mobilizing transposase RayT
MSPKFCNKYRSESHRFPGWNYAGNGMYFLTLVTQDHDFILGHIANGEMYLSDFGEIVHTEWLKSFDIREELILDEYQIMPNHLHAIVVLRKRGNWMTEETVQQQKGRTETCDHELHLDPGQHVDTHGPRMVGAGSAYIQKQNGQTDSKDMHDYEEPQNQDVNTQSDIDLQDSQQQDVNTHSDIDLQDPQQQHVYTHGRAYLQGSNQRSNLYDSQGNPDKKESEEPEKRECPETHGPRMAGAGSANLQDPQRQHVDTHGRAYLQEYSKTENSFKRLPKSISSFVGGFKSGVNSKIDDYIDEMQLRIPKYNKNNHFFQSNYHDHVIRNKEEYLKIKNYIIQNPRNWDKDEFNNPNDD